VKYGRAIRDSLLARGAVLRGQKKIVLRNCGLISADDIESTSGGRLPGVYKVLIDSTPEVVIEQIKSSKLRGRAARAIHRLKWEALRKAKNQPKYVICNADEGDPGAYMNRNEIESDPHRCWRE